MSKFNGLASGEAAGETIQGTMTVVVSAQSLGLERVPDFDCDSELVGYLSVVSETMN